MLRSRIQNSIRAFKQISGGLDPDAQAFIDAHNTATGLTMSAIQQNAINGFVKRLKGVGTTNGTDLWGSFSITAIYPYCPIDDSTANANAYKLNLLNPSSNIITFTNFVAGDFQPTGLSGGTGKIANTGINVDALPFNNYLFSFYSRDLNATGAVGGALNSLGNRALDFSFTTSIGGSYGGYYRSNILKRVYGVNSQGLFVDCYGEQRRNVVTIDNFLSVNVAMDGNDFYLHSRNLIGSANLSSSNEFAGFAIGQANFTSNAHQDWFEAWDYYQSNVITGGRNV